MIKAIINLSLLLLFVLGSKPGEAQQTNQDDRLNQIIHHLKNPGDPYVLVAVHRGDWRNYPENSIPAIQGAIDMEADIVEIDVQRTKDGHLIVMHDERVDRTTNGAGLVSDLTLDSIKTLFLRNGLGRVTVFKVPTLEEAMLTAKGKILVNLDKCYNFFREAHAILEETGTLSQVIIKGQKPAADVKKDFGSLLSSLNYMPMVDLNKALAGEHLIDQARQLNPLAVEIMFRTDTVAALSLLPSLRKKGVGIWINSLWKSLNGGHDDDYALSDPEDAYGWLISKGATIIQTDRPLLLLNYLRMRRLHE